MWRPTPSRSPSRTRPTTRRRAAAALGVVLLLTAGCQDARQRRAEHAVERSLRGTGGYELDRTHCSRVARLVAQQLETKVFMCTVPTEGVTCDEFRATLRAGRFRVERTRRGIDCIGPLH